MSEIRQNKATQQWVIYAPARRKRPEDFQQPSDNRQPLPPFDQACPFCPGNEQTLSAIVGETPSPEHPGWQTRVILNRYPVLTGGDSSRFTQGIYLAMQGHGRHEVIIESPYHNRDIAQMSIGEVGLLIETYHQRYVDLMQADHLMTLIFRNHGKRAGASLKHPHSQIIATEIVPRDIRWREEEAQRYFDTWGRCVYCDILGFERQDKQRVILENPSFIAFIPFAAEVPFEVWIMPKRHQADFGQILDAEKSDLACALQQILVTVSESLQDPDYNYIINTAARYKADEPQLHWYLQLRPRLLTPAGFEIGSGMSVNPSIPEEDANFLKLNLQGYREIP